LQILAKLEVIVLDIIALILRKNVLGKLQLITEKINTDVIVPLYWPYKQMPFLSSLNLKKFKEEAL
jgi:hypothetical protein